MNYATIVRIRSLLDDVAHNLQSVRNWELRLPHDSFFERLPVYVRHYIVWQPIDHSGSQYFWDLRMIELRRERDFPEESLDHDRTANLVAQDLDGDLRFVAQVRAEVDGRHTAAAELSLDPVMLCDYARGSV